MKKKINYFTRLNPPSPVITERQDTVVKTLELKRCVKVVDKDNDIYDIASDYVVINEVDTEKITKSYAGQTGLEAVMKRVAITGDQSLLGGAVYDGEGIVDATNVPTTLGEVKQLAEKVKDYDKLPDELKKGRTVEEFIAQFTQADLDSYVKGLVEAEIAKVKATKEGGAE